VDKQGHRRDYSSAYLRRTYRDGGKVKNETVANLSSLPGHVIDWIEAGLNGQQLVPAGQAVRIVGVAAAWASRGGDGDGAQAQGARAAGLAVPGAGPGAGADHLAGGAARLDTVHPDLVV
jgi:hypothetical protein